MESMARLPLCNHLLQQTLRGVCVESEWVYSVFWRILPRSFPPPKWELGGYLDRSKANKRNWILVWEDGFCDFARSVADDATPGGEVDHAEQSRNSAKLHPELFFKMSHEIYNYGEGLMGKIAADNGHKWIYRNPPERDNRLVSFWHNTIDPQPRIWEAQFKSGIQTIVVVAVREGLVQLGATRQVLEDVDFVMLLQRKFNSLQLACPAHEQPSLATAALPSMLSPDQVMRSTQERKVLKRLGRPDEEEPAPGFTRTLERRLSWSSCDSTVRRGQLLHHLDLPNTSCPENYLFSTPTMQQNDQLITLPLAHDVQAAADHLSLGCISANNIATLTSTARALTTSAHCSFGYQIPCSFRINASVLQGDPKNSTSADSSATAAHHCMASAAAARRSVLPCISNVQALLSNLPAVAPSSPPAALHQHVVNDKSVRLRNPSTAPGPITLSISVATGTSGSSSSQFAASKTADLTSDSTIPELPIDHQLQPPFAPARSGARLRQLQLEDGPVASKKKKPSVNTMSCSTANARHAECIKPTLLEPSVSTAPVHVDSEPDGSNS